MGFMSNQWLNRGQGLRNRRYSPNEVTVRAEAPTDGWSLTNEAPVIWISCSADVRRKLVLAALTEMSDQELLGLLALDLKLRLKNQKGK